MNAPSGRWILAKIKGKEPTPGMPKGSGGLQGEGRSKGDAKGGGNTRDKGEESKRDGRC